ncbi:hypothetical protein MOKP101_38760 [Mycobacterium avium subsp. hominissuis]
MSDLELAVEGWIAALPADEFRALVLRTRPPDEPVQPRRQAASNEFGLG